MNRLPFVDISVEIARLIWLTLGLLFVVDRLEAHIAVIIALIVHAALFLFVLSRPRKVQGQFDRDELVAYKEGRKEIIWRFSRRGLIWLALLVILLMLGNSTGWTSLPFWFSIYVLTDIFIRAGKDASEVDDLFLDPIRKVTGAIPRQRHD